MVVSVGQPCLILTIDGREWEDYWHGKTTKMYWSFLEFRVQLVGFGVKSTEAIP